MSDHHHNGRMTNWRAPGEDPECLKVKKVVAMGGT